MSQLKAQIFLGLILMLLSGCTAAFGSGAPPTATIVALPPGSTPTATLTPPPQNTPLPHPSPTPTSTPLAMPTPEPELTPTLVTQPPLSESTREPSQSLSPPIAEKKDGPLTGAWDFNFGTLDWSQRGSALEGRYHWYGGGDVGRIEGNYLADLRQIQGLWISDRDPTEQGFLQARLRDDDSRFDGTYERRTLSGPWCGVRSGQPLPAGCGFSGTWQIRFGSPPNLSGQANLTQTGQTVQGSFTGADGRGGEIEGQVKTFSITEARLIGTWRNHQNEMDTFEWRLDLTTGRTFTGRRDPGNSEWCGWRSDGLTPDPCGW